VSARRFLSLQARDNPLKRRHNRPVPSPITALGRLNAHFVGRVLTAAVIIVALLLPYWWINQNTRPRIDLMTPLDAAIPFLPWTLPIYESFYALILAAAWVCRAEEFLSTLKALVVGNLIAYACFFTLTAHYPRPDPAVISSPWLRSGFEALFSADAPGNTFPSLHVAVTWLLTLRMRRRRWGGLWLVWGGLVALSTLTVKQHFIADVVGGIALATALNAWMLSPRSVASPARGREDSPGDRRETRG